METVARLVPATTTQHYRAVKYLKNLLPLYINSLKIIVVVDELYYVISNCRKTSRGLIHLSVFQMNLWPTVLFLGCAVPRIDTANILVVLPWPSYSHTNNYMPIFRGLAARGHNVTMFSPFPQKPPLPNLTDIVFPSLKEELFSKLI